MRTKENIEKEIEILETKLSRTRNTVEKASIADQIVDIKNRIKDLDTATEKEVKVSKDAAARIDHKNDKVNKSLITNTGNTFIAQI